MDQLAISPEQERLARKAWDNRKDFTTYDQDIMGEDISPELQAQMDEAIERGRDLTPVALHQEELERVKALSDDLTEPYQWVTPEEYSDEEVRMGRIIDSSELFNKLRNECGICVWYGAPVEAFGKWILGVHVLRAPGAKAEYACWVQQGWMPEFEMIHFSDHGAPLNPKHRGWRTVLMQLIMKGFLDEQVATRVFGEAKGPASVRYNKFLYDWRNRARQETAGTADVAEIGSAPEPPKSIPEVEENPETVVRCNDCNRRIGHNLDCPQHESFIGA